MFTPWKITGVVGIVSALALAVMWVMLKSAEADLKGKDADIARLASVVSGLNAQAVQLKESVLDKEREIAELKAIQLLGNKVVDDVLDEKERAVAQADVLRREMKNARDDATAFELLNGGLCGIEQELAAMRARNNHKDGARADSDPGLVVTHTCTGPLNGSGREIADYALRFAITLKQAAIQLIGIREYQDQLSASSSSGGGG